MHDALDRLDHCRIPVVKLLYKSGPFSTITLDSLSLQGQAPNPRNGCTSSASSESAPVIRLFGLCQDPVELTPTQFLRKHGRRNFVGQSGPSVF